MNSIYFMRGRQPYINETANALREAIYQPQVGNGSVRLERQNNVILSYEVGNRVNLAL